MSDSCIILAGGKGTRLSNLLGELPKCLAPVGNSTFLELQMRQLSLSGISSFILSLGYQAEKIIEHIKTLNAEYDVTYVVEGEPLNTGGAIKHVFESLCLKESLVVNGDTIVSGDLSPMMMPVKKNVNCSIGLCNVSNRARFGGVQINQDSYVVSFDEKTNHTAGLINAGFYRLNIEALQFNERKNFSFEIDLLPLLVQQKSVTGKVLEGKFIDIGVPEDYELFCNNQEDYVK